MPTLAPPAASPASAPITTPTLTSTPTPTAPPKAGPGELRANVARVLSANHGTHYTVGQLKKMLGNSGGAIGNACKVLVKRGEADLVAENPRRYTANANTASAASKAVITPPAPRPAPASAPPAPPRKLAPAPITRPNGQLYHPRQLADLPDVEVLQRLRAANVPVLLYGPPGTGKTSLIEAAFGDLITVAGDGDTTVGDLIHRAELHRIRYSSPGNPGADVQDQGIGCRPSLPVGAGFDPVRNQFNDVALYATWRELLISRARCTCCSLTRSSTWTQRRRCSTR